MACRAAAGEILFKLIRKRAIIHNAMKVTRVAIAERNYLRGVLRAFLLGKKNENYVIGCFKNVPIKLYDEVAAELSAYSNQPRFAELYQIRKRLQANLTTSETKTRWSPWVLSKY
jgi:hypothetical protein